MAYKTYSEKLRDPRWQKKRLEILSRDEFACQLCFDTASTLIVHHRYYLSGKEPWDYPEEILVTLCETCHQYQHENQSYDLEKILKFKGFFCDDVENIGEAFVGLEMTHPPHIMGEIINFVFKNKEIMKFLEEKYFQDLKERRDDSENLWIQTNVTP